MDDQSKGQIDEKKLSIRLTLYQFLDSYTAVALSATQIEFLIFGN